MDNKEYSINEYHGEGTKPVVESGEWSVGIKNYKSGNDINFFDYVEKHKLTDEVFILLQGKCVLLIDKSDGACVDFTCIPLEPGKVYCIKKGIWHNAVVSQDAKIILVENRDTSIANSEVLTLPKEKIESLRSDLKKRYFSS